MILCIMNNVTEKYSDFSDLIFVCVCVKYINAMEIFWKSFTSFELYTGKI